jgi:predicted AAA+ superfamily ATPase
MEYHPQKEELVYRRQLVVSESRSFFLFGARGTGKSTLIQNLPQFQSRCLIIDLLEPDEEEKYSLRPQRLLEELGGNPDDLNWVVIDEVQKTPKLLDVVHKLIETTDLKFALTGSSSRKLKRVGSNLLAGRAFRFFLYPLTSVELGKKMDLDHQLSWGSLPEIFHLKSTKDKSMYLKAYVENYIKEEIVAEQAVRNLNPFRLFLPLCLQNEGEPLNFTKLADSASVDVKTIQKYFEILVDTNLGFFLNSYDKSIRAVQRSAPKFYFFDCGVRRSIEKQLTIPIQKQTSMYGKLFESWFINECHRMNEYNQLDYKFSYLRTKDDAEVDLIIERPDGSMTLVEIKSSEKIEDRHLRHLLHFKKDFPHADLICVCQEKKQRKASDVVITPWQSALKILRLLENR